MSTRQAFSAFYAKSFERRPYLTLAVVNGALGFISDSLAQGFSAVNSSKQLERIHAPAKSSIDNATEKASSGGYDVARSARFFAFNVGMAPILAEWNKYIEYRFPLSPKGGADAAAAATSAGSQAAIKQAAMAAGKTSLLAWGKRVAVDQIAFAPFGLVMFTGAMGLMEGRGIEGTKQKFRDMYWPALLANWQVWPLVQAINFRFMPLRYRVPFTGGMGVLWTIYLSLLNVSKGGASQKAAESVEA